MSVKIATANGGQLFLIFSLPPDCHFLYSFHLSILFILACFTCAINFCAIPGPGLFTLRRLMLTFPSNRNINIRQLQLTFLALAAGFLIYFGALSCLAHFEWL